MGVAICLIWVLGFVFVDGASWRRAADDLADSNYEQCLGRTHDLERCRSDRETARQEIYSGIRWDGIIILALIPVPFYWLIAWLVGRKMKPTAERK
jgi:hypothetical protein